MRVAIIHEWLTNRAGSEQCVEALCDAFPDHIVYAPVLNHNVFESFGEVRTSWLQKVPGASASHVRVLPLVPLAMRSLAVREPADLLIRSFHSFATMARNKTDAPEIIYCYTPPRFLYGLGSMDGEGRLVRLGATGARSALRSGDRRRFRRSDQVVGISRHISSRIEAVYGISAPVVHPPVDVERFSKSHSDRGDHFVMCGRLVPYKRPDVAIEAFRGLPFRLDVIGDGRQRAALERSAPPNVRFLGRVSDSDLPGLLSSARAFVFPSEEDFGIAPVEALASGTPVVAFGQGGALDYVHPGLNGLLVSEQSPHAFARAICAAAAEDWNFDEVRRTAAPFTRQRFVEQMREIAEETSRRRGKP